MMSASGLPTGHEGWGQKGLAEELLALVPVVLWQGPAQVTGHWGPTGQRGPAVQQGGGASWHPTMALVGQTGRLECTGGCTLGSAGFLWSLLGG